MKLKNLTVNQVLSSVLVAGTLLTSSLGTVNAIANAEDIGDYPKAEVPNKNSEASNQFAMIAKFTQKTKLEFLNAKNKLKDVKTKDGRAVKAYVGLTNNDCGKDMVKYTNVGLWKGKEVDVVYRLDQLTKAGFKGGEWIQFNNRNIGLAQGGYKEVKVTQRFVYHDSGKEADITGSYMTFNDIDAHQAIGFSDDTMNRVDKIYIDDKAKDWIKVVKKGNTTYFGSDSSEDINPNDPRGKMTMLFKGNAITYTFNKDWSTYNLDRELDYKNSQFDQYYGYIGEKPVPTETLKPAKLVSDHDEKDKTSNTLDQIGEEYDYTVSHSVPAEESQFYYKSYVIEDQLINELEIMKDSIKVTDSDGKDVTAKFDNQTEGNHLKISAKSDTLKNKDFYGKDYKVHFKVKVKTGASLEKYKDKDGNYVLPNTASVSKDGKKQETNKVTTKLTPNKSEIMKMIIDDGKAVDSDTLSKEDPVVTYRIDNVVPNDQFLKSLVLNDDVDKHLELLKDSVKVIASNADDNKVTVDSSNSDNESSSTTASSEDSTMSSDDTATSTTSSEKTKAVDVDSAIKTAQAIADKYKDAKSGTVESVVKNNADMVVNALESLKKGSNVAIDKNIEIVESALNPNAEANKPTGEEKEALETLKAILESIKDDMNPSSTESGKHDEQESTVDEEETSETLTDEAEAGKVDDSVIQEDAKSEMTGDALPNGKDVTKEGKLEIKGNNISWTANHPQDFAGKKLTLVFQAKLKEGVKISDLKDGKIPNTAVMTVNGKDHKSNTVYVDVTPAKEKVTPKKEAKPTPPSSSSESTSESIEGDPKPKSIPKQEKPSYLPQTGTDAMKEVGIGVLGAGIGAIAGFFLGKKNKK